MNQGHNVAEPQRVFALGRAAGWRGRRIGTIVGRYGTFVSFILICIVLSCLSEVFLTWGNISNLLVQVSTLAIIATGLTVCMAAGEIDISTGSACSLVGVVAACLLRADHHPFFVIMVGLVIGLVVGIANGVAAAILRIPSLIGTMAVSSILNGASILYSRGEYMSIMAAPDWFLAIGRGKIWGAIPVPTVIMVVIFFLVYFLLDNMSIGRYVYSVGDNPKASRLSGVNPACFKILGFCCSAVASSLGGIILLARQGVAKSLELGIDLALPAIAAVIMGTTMFKDGEAHLTGTLVGVLILGVLTNGLTLLGMGVFVQQIVWGLVIIAGLSVSAMQRRQD